MSLNFRIREIIDEYEDCANVIREAFSTVAKEFGITRQIAPTNPAFIEADALVKMKEKGARMYGAYTDDKLVGFVALERASEELFYLEKLCVLPMHRHHGYGEKLISHIFDTAENLGGKRVSIGIINDNTILKNWYIKNGFVETGRRVFEHLPFEVCFMERIL